MTFAELKEHVMFQTNNDADDLPDYMPHVDSYLNEGYTRLCKAWAKGQYSPGDYPDLKYDEDIPALPYWAHRALADWATWLIYRNGNPQKQNRGLYFKDAFEQTLRRIMDEGGIDGVNDDGSLKKYDQFRNIPK